MRLQLHSMSIFLGVGASDWDSEVGWVDYVDLTWVRTRTSGGWWPQRLLETQKLRCQLSAASGDLESSSDSLINLASVGEHGDVTSCGSKRQKAKSKSSTAWIVIQRISDGILPWVALLQLTAVIRFYTGCRIACYRKKTSSNSSAFMNMKKCSGLVLFVVQCAGVGHGNPKPDLSRIWNSTDVLKWRVLCTPYLGLWC